MIFTGLTLVVCSTRMNLFDTISSQLFRILAKGQECGGGGGGSQLYFYIKYTQYFCFMLIHRFGNFRRCYLLRSNESELKDLMRKFVILFSSLNLKIGWPAPVHISFCHNRSSIFAKNGEIFHQKLRLPSNLLVLFTSVSVPSYYK
jgi:hypothetical protein